MPQTKQINLRIDEQLLTQFKQKAEAEYGSMSRFLKLQIESYVAQEPLANDAELTALMYAVKALNQFVHDVNASKESLVKGGGKSATHREMNKIKNHTEAAIQAFKQSLAQRKDCFV